MRSIRRAQCVVCGKRLGSRTRAGLRNCQAKLAEVQAESAGPKSETPAETMRLAAKDEEAGS